MEFFLKNSKSYTVCFWTFTSLPFIEVLEDDYEGGVPDRMESILERAEIRGIEKGRAEGEIQGRMEGRLNVLASLVRKGLLQMETAADEAGLTPAEFLEKTAKMTKND